jgi:hypothetical protein
MLRSVCSAMPNPAASFQGEAGVSEYDFAKIVPQSRTSRGALRRLRLSRSQTRSALLEKLQRIRLL